MKTETIIVHSKKEFIKQLREYFIPYMNKEGLNSFIKDNQKDMFTKWDMFFTEEKCVKFVEKVVKEEYFHWVCNECDFPNLTSAVSEEEIESGRHSCVSCGGVEFHKKYI
jgi:hypothetical protein